MDSATCGATTSDGSAAPCRATNTVPISSIQKLDPSGMNQSLTTLKASSAGSSRSGPALARNLAKVIGGLGIETSGRGKFPISPAETVAMYGAALGPERH